MSALHRAPVDIVTTTAGVVALTWRLPGVCRPSTTLWRQRVLPIGDMRAPLPRLGRHKWTGTVGLTDTVNRPGRVIDRPSPFLNPGAFPSGTGQILRGHQWD